MSRRKERLTVTVDPELVEAGNQAVSSGLADSLSAWVNDALAVRAARDNRLRALSEAIAEYEAEFGEITAEELATRRRADAETARVARGRRQETSRAVPKRRRRGVA